MDIIYQPEIIFPQGSGYKRTSADTAAIEQTIGKIYEEHQVLIDNNKGYFVVKTNSKDKVFVIELTGSDVILDKIQSGDISVIKTVPFSDKTYT